MAAWVVSSGVTGGLSVSVSVSSVAAPSPSTVSSAVSAENINIENMLNRSKKDYAYTVLDVAEDVSEATLDKIRAVEGVIRVRKI